MKVNDHKPGAPSWADLASPDLAATRAFYTALFGWTAHVAPQEEAGGDTIFNHDGVPAAAAGPLFHEGHANPDKPYTEFQLDGRTVAGMLPMIGEAWPADLPDHWMVNFGVADRHAAAERIRQLGGSVS